MDLNAEQRQQLLADHVESLGITVFFSYARKDKALRDQLETHLSLLQRQAVISSWQEYQVTPGKPRAKEIDTHLQTAHIILLLISPDFIATDYCYLMVRVNLRRFEGIATQQGIETGRQVQQG